MTSSQREQFWVEIEDLSSNIPIGKLEYMRERLRNDLYDFVFGKFLEEHEARGLTKADLARRLNRDPGQLNRLLGAPGNWTLGMVSDLLVGISGEALTPQSTKVPGPPRNFAAHELLSSGSHIRMGNDEPVTGSVSTITTTSIP